MTPQERIKADAEAYASDRYGEYASNCNDLEYYKWKECVDVYIAGATAEAELAQKLVEALEAVLPYLKAAGTNGNHWVPQVEQAIQNKSNAN